MILDSLDKEGRQMNAEFTENQSSRDIIKEKLHRSFDGKIVRKDLTKKSLSMALKQ